MNISAQHPTDLLLHALQDGLPIVPRPYAELAKQLGWSEREVIEEMDKLSDSGRVRRMGIVVKHRPLGFKANAMVVWDIADDRIEEIAAQMSKYDGVTLCYERPRRLPEWPYNLFCMIHGYQREKVLERLQQMITDLDLADIPHQPLFSTRCFKQCGGRYLNKPKSQLGAGHG